MKYVCKLCVFSLLLVVLTGCKSLTERNSAALFDETQQLELKNKAKEYTNEQYQQGDVPLNTYIKITGEVIESDSKDKEKIKQNDRFIIQNNGYRYQIINHSNEEIKIYDNVTVYGEYYGFIKAIWLII